MCAANFVEVHTYDFEGTVFAEAPKRGMGVVAMKILGGRDAEGAKLSATELKKALATVRAYQPFSDRELSKISTKGKQMAKDWGELRGPVAWNV